VVVLSCSADLGIAVGLAGKGGNSQE